jgi:hypothetical protein
VVANDDGDDDHDGEATQKSVKEHVATNN